jgi:hypothetical protein
MMFGCREFGNLRRAQNNSSELWNRIEQTKSEILRHSPVMRVITSGLYIVLSSSTASSPARVVPSSAARLVRRSFPPLILHLRRRSIAFLSTRTL